MGEMNFDLTRNKMFLAVPYTCAAIGAGVGLALAPIATPLGLAAAGVIGAVAGGIGLPVLGVAAGVCAYALCKGAKEVLTLAKKEGAILPIGMLFVGISSAKALFVIPFKGAEKAFRSLFSRKKEGQPPAPAIAAPPAGPSALAEKTVQPDFNPASAPPAEVKAPAPVPVLIPLPPALQ